MSECSCDHDVPALRCHLLRRPSNFRFEHHPGRLGRSVSARPSAQERKDVHTCGNAWSAFRRRCARAFDKAPVDVDAALPDLNEHRAEPSFPDVPAHAFGRELKLGLRADVSSRQDFR